ncbi:MAG: thymidine kinase [Lachnospiraceae bacterium]|jgi:thymidine kinase|nr:thymidine kinase [Lachnospiraceae bacterium]
MAKLYFRHGAMGSCKTANALMVDYNYFERGKQALLVKPKIDDRDGEGIMRSRMGLEKPCGFVEDLVQMSDEDLMRYDCVIVDEAQFCTKEQVRFFVHIVDDLEIPVICYGLRTDFTHSFFEGSLWLMAWADAVEEIKTVCWCGHAATCNARIDSEGNMVKEGEQVVLGANDKYISLCRRHYNEGNTGPRRLIRN